MTERIDAWTHILPKKYFAKLQTFGSASGRLKRWLTLRSLYDLDERFRIMDGFPRYRQFLTPSLPPVEELADGQGATDLARLWRDAGSLSDPRALLEPILAITISVPNEFTSKVQRIVSGRRGQILGFDAKPGFTGWDEVKCSIPQAETHDLIVELRSTTQGVGTYSQSFDRLAELTGRLADKAIEARKAMLEENGR